MPRLLIVHHTPSPALHALLDAARAGASDPQLQGVDVVVRPAGATGDDGSPTTRSLPADLVDRLADVDGAARVDGNVTTFGVFVVGTDGKLVGAQGAPGLGGNYTGAPAGHGVAGLHITAGSAPTQPASPAPLTPSGFILVGMSWLPTAIEGKSSARCIW